MSTDPAVLSGATVAPLSLRLREGTRERHDSVEHAAAINRLIVVKVPSPETAATAQERDARVRALAEYREAYRLFLISAHGFEAAVVERLAGSPAFEEAKASGYADEGTPSTLLIREDLERVFGAASATGMPAMAGLPEVRSLAEFAGMEYVRRGSRAGGAVIGAVVTHNLGFGRDSGASFLQQYGKDTKRVLVAFKEWVDSLPLSEADCLAAVKSANETFLAVERWHRLLERDYFRA